MGTGRKSDREVAGVVANPGGRQGWVFFEHLVGLMVKADLLETLKFAVGAARAEAVCSFLR